LADYNIDCGHREFKNHWYILESPSLRLCLPHDSHDLPAGGHLGCFTTYELLSRGYYWPNMRNDVERYTKNCHICCRTKPSRQTPHSLLHPLPMPDQPWKYISLDFVIGLLLLDRFDAIYVVDRLTKIRHFIPYHTTVTAEDLADIFLNNIWKMHGLPQTIISERGPQFSAQFW
jgi:hypothetical protein